MRIVVILHLMGLILLNTDLSAEESLGSKLYLHSGILGGYESDIRTIGFIMDFGYERINYPIDAFESIERIGIAYNMTLCRWSFRHSVGPKLTWKLTENWRLHVMGGPIFSNSNDEYKAGFHSNIGFSYMDEISFNFVYETMPPNFKYANNNAERVHNYYGGVLLHGKVGAALPFVLFVLFIVGASNMSGSFGGT